MSEESGTYLRVREEGQLQTTVATLDEEALDAIRRIVREEVVAPRYDREVLVDVIIHHGRTDIRGCHCGWAVLGASHAEHVADVYELTLIQKDDAQG